MNYYLLIVIFTCANSLKLPKYLKPCSRKDSDVNKCAVTSGTNGWADVMKGDKKYHIPVLSPLKLDEVNLDVGESLKMKFLNLTIYGMEKGKLTDMVINTEKNHWSLTIEMPSLEMILTYDIKGRILILPIVGHGPGNFTLENVQFLYDFDYTLIKKDQVEYVNLINPTLKFTPSRVYYDFQNLFNGDKRLGDEMNRFLNENWDEVLKEILPALSETINAIVTSVLKGYLKKVPFDEILLP